MKTASKIVAVLLCLAMTVGALIPCVSATADVTDAQNDVLSAPLSPVAEPLEEEEIPEPAFDLDMLKVTYQFNEDKSAIRLVTTVDGLEYAEVGFTLTMGDQRARITMHEVYSSILGAGETYTPDMAGAPTSKYFALFNVTDIPTEFTLFVKAFVTTEGGDTHYGAVREIKKGSGNLTFDPNGTASGPVVSWRDLNWSGVPTHAHLFGEWITVKEPSTTEEGLMERRCACGEKETQAIAKIPALEYTPNEDQQSYSVTGIGECQDTDIVIPSTYKGLPVTSIDSRAFDGCSSLTSIVIPNGMTDIGVYAFYGCTSLASIVIPNSITNIGNAAFASCTSLKKVFITDLEAWCRISFAETSANPLSNGADLYINDVLATDIIIPDGITGIGNAAFYYCKSLKSIVLPDSVTSIGNAAFEFCTNLVSITIPNSVTGIGHYAFYDCFDLTSIVIPDSVTSIGNYAFNGCSSLQYNTYDNGLYLGNEKNPYVIFVEASSTSITSCNIHENTKFIYTSAFEGCENLASIVIPGSITSIGSRTFMDCSSLTSIIIPDSVTSIGGYAFYNCSKLTNVTIGNSVTSIDLYTFYNCTKLTNITIGNSVTSIGDYAFHGCGLTDIAIPDGVTSIGEKAFYNCSSLTSIVIPDSVTSIGGYAFYPCSSLTTIYCEAASQPSGWNTNWNARNRPVVWGYTG
ncbi:MAG: leucine-rich repeat domain-containing protein [Clostridia bacterium]|nr:leucine-rich repeat domain-containing protein [Clostridia bacterium]